jgi:hypothetical protein
MQTTAREIKYSLLRIQHRTRIRQSLWFMELLALTAFLGAVYGAHFHGLR